MNNQTKTAFPVIRRDADSCLSYLSTALEALSDLCQPVMNKGDEQLNLLKRSQLAGLFMVLHDYADAARRAVPEVQRSDGDTP